MTFPGFPGSFPRRPGRPAQPIVISRRAKRILAVLVALVVFITCFIVFGLIYTDWLWFKSVGYQSVFSDVLRAKIELFVAFGLVMPAVVGAGEMAGDEVLRAEFAQFRLLLGAARRGDRASGPEPAA